MQLCARAPPSTAPRSTFRDFQAEREHLVCHAVTDRRSCARAHDIVVHVTHTPWRANYLFLLPQTYTIFPRFERLCAQRGAQFTPIDLRWGITSEQSGSGQVRGTPHPLLLL